LPQFAHIPLIHGSDGAKMSKRHGATSVIDYREMGYLPEALRNYLLRLGWSHGDAEIISDAEAISWFSFDHVGKSPSRFDFAKLTHINKHYIKAKSDEELFDLMKDCFDVEISENSKNRIIRATKFLKDRANVTSDLLTSAKTYIDDFHAELSVEDQQVIAEKKSLISNLEQVFSKMEDWSHDGVKNSLNEFAFAQNIKIKDFGPALRIALTFSSASAGGIFDVVEILGKIEVLKRISLATK
jgi:glutamyl-tRNA synthetase